MAYYEEKVKFARETVIVCVPHDKYGEFLDALFEFNSERKISGRPVVEVESLRPNVKRLTKGALRYEDFRGAYF